MLPTALSSPSSRSAPATTARSGLRWTDRATSSSPTPITALVKEVLPNGHLDAIGHGFCFPAGVAVDGAGDVFVADSGNNAVEEVLPNGTIQTSVPGLAAGRRGGGRTGDVFVADTATARSRRSCRRDHPAHGHGVRMAAPLAVDGSGTSRRRPGNEPSWS